MADEIINQDNADQSEAEKRFKDLSNKVRTTAEERDEKDRLLQEQTAKNVVLEKENAFNTGFVDMLGMYPTAKEHKDDIKAKVLSGYSVEDATIAVLGKAGKFSAPVRQDIAGGSADTVMTQGAQKETKDMTQSERRDVLSKELLWA